MSASPFVLFGNIHLVTMLGILLTSIFLPKIYKNKPEVQKSIMSKIIAMILISHVVISPYK
ncbi:MAG: TIGR02206 family membrane protein, partial [Proteobacteria bacterium]|nr:TIGR02206 family membrane protein [Pseudomonadota bacterium]